MSVLPCNKELPQGYGCFLGLGRAGQGRVPRRSAWDVPVKGKP